MFNQTADVSAHVEAAVADMKESTEKPGEHLLTLSNQLLEISLSPPAVCVYGHFCQTKRFCGEEKEMRTFRGSPQPQKEGVVY